MTNGELRILVANGKSSSVSAPLRVFFLVGRYSPTRAIVRSFSESQRTFDLTTPTQQYLGFIYESTRCSRRVRIAALTRDRTVFSHGMRVSSSVSEMERSRVIADVDDRSSELIPGRFECLAVVFRGWNFVTKRQKERLVKLTSNVTKRTLAGGGRIAGFQKPKLAHETQKLLPLKCACLCHVFLVRSFFSCAKFIRANRPKIFGGLRSRVR